MALVVGRRAIVIGLIALRTGGPTGVVRGHASIEQIFRVVD